eukprot:9289767-Pyramimonas_sp.AAC.1
MPWPAWRPLSRRPSPRRVLPRIGLYTRNERIDQHRNSGVRIRAPLLLRIAFFFFAVVVRIGAAANPGPDALDTLARPASP